MKTSVMVVTAVFVIQGWYGAGGGAASERVVMRRRKERRLFMMAGVGFAKGKKRDRVG